MGDDLFFIPSVGLVLFFFSFFLGGVVEKEHIFPILSLSYPYPYPYHILKPHKNYTPFFLFAARTADLLSFSYFSVFGKDLPVGG